MSFLSQVTKLQLAAGITFLIAKIVNLGTAALIFGSFAVESLRTPALISLAVGVGMILLTLVLCGVSHIKERQEVEGKKNAIDDILSDPEARQELLARLNNVQV